MNVVVYTSIIGMRVRDSIKPHYPIDSDELKTDGVQFVCFSNKFSQAPEGTLWQMRPPAYFDPNPTRTARWHKTHPHRLFPDADVVIWHDGNMWMKVNPFQLVRDALVDDAVKLATFKHPDRNCVFQEVQACIRFRKDDPNIMRWQVQTYQKEGMPFAYGLFETGVLVSRNHEVRTRIMEAWWTELKYKSIRDQLSLPYVLWKHNLREHVGLIPGRGNKNDYFGFKGHR